MATLNDNQSVFYGSTAKEFRNSFTSLNELSTASASPLIDLKSIYGFTDLRDKETSVGTGSVLNGNAYYTVATGTTANSSCKFDTSETGRYIAGMEATAGLDVCIPTLPTGEQVARWGYFDEKNGFGTGIDKDGMFTFIRKGSVDRIHRESEWQSRITTNGFDPTNHNIYRFPFRWYGAGPVKYEVSITHDTLYPSLERYDIFQAEPGELITNNANLPVRAEVENGGTASNFEIRIGGRQFFIVGRYNPLERVTSEYRIDQAISTTFVPLVSFKQKTDNGLGFVSNKMYGVDLIVASNPIIWQIRLNPTLDVVIDGDPSNVPAAETSLWWDNTATTITGGQKIFEGMASSGTGNSSAALPQDLPDLDLPTGSTITLCARTISGNATVSSVLKAKEEW